MAEESPRATPHLRRYNCKIKAYKVVLYTIFGITATSVDMGFSGKFALIVSTRVEDVR